MAGVDPYHAQMISMTKYTVRSETCGRKNDDKFRNFS